MLVPDVNERPTLCLSTEATRIMLANMSTQRTHAWTIYHKQTHIYTLQGVFGNTLAKALCFQYLKLLPSCHE